MIPVGYETVRLGVGRHMQQDPVTHLRPRGSRLLADRSH